MKLLGKDRLRFCIIYSVSEESSKYDPTETRIDANFNDGANLIEFYGHVEGELSRRTPEPRDRKVSIHAFVEAYHAGNIVTRRSQTGISMLVHRYSKRQIHSRGGDVRE